MSGFILLALALALVLVLVLALALARSARLDGAADEQGPAAGEFLGVDELL